MRLKWTKHTPYRYCRRFLKDNKSLGLKENEVLFCMLVWVGYKRTHAYEIAFPESQANNASTLQMASRLLNSWRVHRFFDYIRGKVKAFEYRYDRDTEEMLHEY